MFISLNPSFLNLPAAWLMTLFLLLFCYAYVLSSFLTMYHCFYLWLVSSILDSTKWRICPKLLFLRCSHISPSDAVRFSYVCWLSWWIVCYPKCSFYLYKFVWLCLKTTCLGACFKKEMPPYRSRWRWHFPMITGHLHRVSYRFFDWSSQINCPVAYFWNWYSQRLYAVATIIYSYSSPTLDTPIQTALQTGQRDGRWRRHTKYLWWFPYV